LESYIQVLGENERMEEEVNGGAIESNVVLHNGVEEGGGVREQVVAKERVKDEGVHVRGNVMVASGGS